MWRKKTNEALTGFPGPAAWLAALLLTLACLVPAGCGKKEWPSPRTEKDRFSWASVRAGRDGSCLVIRGELQGAMQNLKQVVLQLETSEELCPGCPFTPNQRASYALSDPSLRREGPVVTITHCPVQPDTAVRLRLEGENIYQQIPPASSDLVELEAEGLNATTQQAPTS
jgi:hypothetical protein